MLSTLWAFPMAVQYGVAMPFWVASRTTPTLVNGDSTGVLCDIGLRIKTLAQHQPGFHDTLDTNVLVDGHGGGLYATTLPLEDRIFASTDSALAIWRAAGQPDSAGTTSISARFAQLAYDSLNPWPRPGQLWVPPRAVTSLTLYYIPNTGLRLHWSAVTQDTLSFPITPSGYTIYRSRTGSGILDSLTTVTATQYTFPLPPDSSRGAYIVKARR